MKVIQHTSEHSLLLRAQDFFGKSEEFLKEKIWDNDVSVSFRTFDAKGNTIELHIYYKP